MGMDASVYFKTTKRVSQEELAELNYRFKEASSFGWGDFPIQEMDFQKDNLPYYKVESLSRYYSEGYARGDFPEIYMMFQWIKGNFENAIIYYGGDTYDYDGDFETPELTGERESELLNYWVKNGSLLYRQRVPEQEYLKRECPKHKGKIMSQYMFTGGGGGVNCLACGYAEETLDGGKTWTEVKK